MTREKHGHKWLGLVVLAFVTMYFIPQIWYFALAMFLLVLVFALLLTGLLLLTKALGFTMFEVWLARKVLRKK